MFACAEHGEMMVFLAPGLHMLVINMQQLFPAVHIGTSALPVSTLG